MLMFLVVVSAVVRFFVYCFVNDESVQLWKSNYGKVLATLTDLRCQMKFTKLNLIIISELNILDKPTAEVSSSLGLFHHLMRNLNASVKRLPVHAAAPANQNSLSAILPKTFH